MFSNNVAKGKKSQEFKTNYKQIPEVWLKMVIASVVKKHLDQNVYSATCLQIL